MVFLYVQWKHAEVATYKNYLSMLKILFRDFMGKGDMIKDFKFPRQDVKPKFLPSKKDLKTPISM